MADGLWSKDPLADTGGASAQGLWSNDPLADDEPKDAPPTSKRRDVPEATVGSAARDIAAGVLQIGPTAIKGVADLARLATGDRVGKDTSDAMERGMSAIRGMVGSERAAAQRENFQRDMSDDEVGIGETLMRNKGALADQLLPTVGSMFLPVGAAGAAGKLAGAMRGAKALDAATLASRVAAAQKAAGIGATAAQNAADTFSELLDKGASLRDAYLGAGITVPFSVVAGALTGGGAEVAAARALTGRGAAKVGAKQFAQAAGQEGAQEMGEELGQITGEAVATGEAPSVTGAGKQLAVAGTLGAVMGGGVDVATQVSHHGAPASSAEAGNHPAPVPDVAPVSRAAPSAEAAQHQRAQHQRAQQPDGAPDTMDAAAAEVRLAELEVIDSATGLSAEQQAERAALARRVEAQAARDAEMEAIGESPEAVAAAGAPEAASEAARAFDPAAAQAKTWPQFVAERGEKVSTLRKGTPEWDRLQNEWAAVKTQRAGFNPEGTGAVGAATPEIQNRDRARPASVVQMQGMAQSPDYLRLGVSRSPESGAPMVFAVGDQVQAAHALGRADTAVMSDGQRVPFQYAVMEAADVQPSNFADGAVNPLFDGAHPGVVKALNNGRTAGLRAAYERGTASAYKRELMADSAMHGIDPAVIEGMQAPVLVRLYSEKDNQVNMGAKSQGQALGLSASEQAATDAALVDGGVLEVFDSGALDSAANRDFARAFIGRLQEQGQDVAGMLDANGALSPAGVTRLQAALVHKAYSDGDLVESMFGSTDSDIRAIGEALKSVAGEWANMRNAAEAGAVNPQVDVTGNLLQAIRLVQKARRERASLHDAIQQVDMVTGDVVDELTVGVLRMLYTGHYLTRAVGRDRLVESLREYIGAALATRAEGDMFGEQVGPAAILTALSGQPTTQSDNATSTQPAGRPNPAAAQSERGAAGGDPVGSGAAEPGQQERGREPDRAGQEAAETGGRGEGQDAQDSIGQPDRQGDQSSGQDSRGAVAPALELSSYTPEEIRAQQQAQEAIDNARAKDDADAAAAEKARQDRAETGARMEASADHFKLGQDAHDALSGQSGIFDEPADAALQAEPGNGRLKSSNPSIVAEREAGYSSADAYETDLFGEPLPAPERKPAHGQRAPARARNASTDASVPGDTPAPAGDFTVRTVIGQQGERSLGTNEVLTPAEAAQATSYLTRSAVERFDALVTDEAGKPLAVVGGFKGALSQTSVYPATIMGEAIRIKGAARIWFSHNHPSGEPRLSAADRRINEQLADVFRGSGIESMGLMAVAGGRYEYTSPTGRTDDGGDVPAPSKPTKVPVIEREQVRDDVERETVNSPVAARRIAVQSHKAGGDGVLLMDAQMKVIGWVPISDAMRGLLRDTGALASIYRAASESNASAAILVHDGSLDKPARGGITVGNNIAAALAKVDVRPLDSINVATGQSAAEQGLEIAAGPVFRRSAASHADEGRGLDVQSFLGIMDAAPATPTSADREAAIARVRAVVDAIRAGWANGPTVHVVFDVHDPLVPRSARNADRDQTSAGASGPQAVYVGGQVYLFASELATPVQAATALLHEVLGHHGLRTVFGARLDGILRQIGDARRAQVIAKARSYGLLDAKALERAGLDADQASDRQVWGIMSESHRLMAAEEVLAEIAERHPEIGFVRRAVAAVVSWLRAHVPGFRSLQLSDGEVIRDFILPAREWVERGARAEPGGAPAASQLQPAFSRAESAVKQEIRTVLDAARGPGHAPQKANIGAVPGWLVESARQAGLDIEGYSHMLDGSAVRHIIARHYDPRTEKGRGQLAVTDADLENLPALVANPDRVVFGTKNRLGRDQVVYVKKMEDGSVLYLEEVRSKRRELAAVSIRKYPATMNAETLVSTLHPNAQGDGGNGLIVFDSPATGNTPPMFRRSGVGVAAQARGTLAALQAKVQDLTSREAVDAWLYRWQDKFIDLKRIQQTIKDLNGTVSETNDAYQGEELYHKRVAKRAANFLRDEVRPLLKGLNDAKVGIAEFERFLHARHAPEANRVMAERNPNQEQLEAKRADADKAVEQLRQRLQRARAAGSATVALQKALGMALLEQEKWASAEAFRGTEEERLSLSGMSDAQAQAIMGALSPERRQRLDALAARVDRINAGTLKVLEDYGLMERATLQAWRDTYQHYVPLHRDEAHPDGKAHPIGQGFSTKGEASKRRTGSTEKVTNILSHVLMQREAALTRGEKNNVAKKLYLLAAQNPDDNLWSLAAPTKKAVDPDTGLVRTVVDLEAVKDAVSVRIGGQNKYIIFNKRNESAARLALAMKNLDAMELDRLTRTMGKLTRWFAAVNTQYNPVFGAVNLIRDTQGMLLQLSTTPLAGKQGEVLRNVRANLGAIYGDLRAQRKGAGPGQGAWARLFEQMQLDGGTTGYRDLYATPEDRAKALEKELNKLEEGNARAAAQGVVDWLSDFNETMESTTRLAVYKAALDHGLSRQEAASIAKNITVNFNRKGRNTAVAGSWFAFLNAAIQGNKRMVETLAGPAGRKVMIGGVTLGMLSAMAGMALMGGGGADDEWKKIPEFVKERNIIIPLGRQDYVSIPMPLGFHVFPNIGRKMVEFAMHDDPVQSRAGYLADMALIALNAFNPLGGADNLMQMVTPTPFDPVVALATNKDWTGRAIERPKRGEGDITPGHARAKDAASIPSRWLARGINAATGGNEWREGAWSPTPDAIDYLFGQLTGGVGRELVKAGKMTAAAATGEELAPHQVILAGRFYGNTRGTAGQAQAYHDNLKRIDGDLAEAKGRVERGEDVDAVLLDVPLAVVEGAANVLDKRVSNLVKMRRQLQAGGDPNKRELVKEVNAEIESSMYLLNQAVEGVLAERRGR